MKFKFIADAEFEAIDLDDAFWKLAEHFLSLRDEKEQLEFTGKMNLFKND